MPNWLLPDYIADILPSQSRKFEELRRRLLDNFKSYGYELIIPPVLEYTESLMPVPDRDLDVSMFKMVDQLSGRTIGLRPDMTIQAARIDAHLLNRKTITKLCYADKVFHTKPMSLRTNREPFQVGAEVYGYSGVEADLEIQSLAISSLKKIGFNDISLNLSHAGILPNILKNDPLAFKYKSKIIDLLKLKKISDLKLLCSNFSNSVQMAILSLNELYGGIEVIEKAKDLLPKDEKITTALNDLLFLAKSQYDLEVSFDLADFSSYQYESGTTFAIFLSGYPNTIGRGGRYDHVGDAFGRARPATGFSMDLRELIYLLPNGKIPSAILAPWGTQERLIKFISELRIKGEIVVQQFPGQILSNQDFNFDREIIEKNGKYVLQTISK